MKLEQFEFFLQVAETHSMQEAADILHTSVQNVSKTIIGLEKELNIKLFSRNSFGTFLTAEGTELYPYVRTVVENVSNIKKKYTANIDYSDASSQKINILCTRILQNDIHKVISNMNRHAHQVTGSFSTNDPGEINPLLEKDIHRVLERFDIVVTAVFSDSNYYIKSQDIPVYFLDKGFLGVTVNRQSTLANVSSVSIKQLLHHNLVLYTTDTGRLSYIQQALDHLNCTITPTHTCNSIDISQAMIKENSRNYSFVFYRSSCLDPSILDSDNLIIPLIQQSSVDYLLFLNPQFAQTNYGALLINEIKRIFPDCRRL